MPGFPSPGCLGCHDEFSKVNDYFVFAGDCTACHAEIDTPNEHSRDSNNNFEFYKPSGPHSGYLTTTSKCRTCHSVHNAPAGGILLLPAGTIYGTCFTCHDGTGGWGVYGAIAARGGTVSDTSRHGLLVDGVWSSTNIVPGGDPGGGDLAGTFSGAGGVLMCNDCHSPHDADTVNPFVGDRARLRQQTASYSSSKLLKRRPTGMGASTPVDDYGSEWCLACHAGRSSSGTAHNHPAETGGFTYSRVARLVSNDPTGSTELGPLGGLTNTVTDHIVDVPLGADNRGFLMPWPRTPQQSGHAPICQQCHEDSRNVGQLIGNGSVGDAASAVVVYGDSVTWNGTAWVTSTVDNPRFQNFPHETVNPNMLVETYDDLCLNCHPTAQLP